MSLIKLSKYASEEKHNISDLVQFLKENGIQKNENPTETVNEREIELIKNNFHSFLIRKEGGYEEYKKNFFSKIVSNTDISEPLELKIIEAAENEKLLIERTIGFVDFNWEYAIAKYAGEVAQPVPFTIFDEVICDLLLIQELSKSDIAKVLGLNSELDPAENSIIEKTLEALKSDAMIDGSESGYWLTDLGKAYAKDGVKYSTFVRDFEIYFDTTGRNKQQAKDILRKLKSEKIPGNFVSPAVELHHIREFSGYQAPEVHFPEKNYMLQSASLKNVEKYQAKVWVIFLENFRDNTLRVLVYDEKQDALIQTLSEDLNNRVDLKNNIFERLLQNNDDLKLTDENKTPQQINEENELINKQKELDSALLGQDILTSEKIRKEIKREKIHFNSVEFEMELKNIFDDSNDELWFISPWLRFHAIKYRLNFFEKQLAQGTKIFIVYSEPENDKALMADERAMSLLIGLEKKYSNFYMHQLSTFHYKNVWVRNFADERKHYTGSFNILSFYVDRVTQKVRQEQMTKCEWDDDTDDKYYDFIKKFGEKYINQEIGKYNDLVNNLPAKVDKSFLTQLKMIDNLKLQPFLGIGIEVFDKMYRQLEAEKKNTLEKLGRGVFLEEYNNIKKDVEKLHNVLLNKDSKKAFRQKLDNIKNDFDYLTASFETELASLNQMITKLRTK